MLSHQLEQNRIDGEKTIIQVRTLQVENYRKGYHIQNFDIQNPSEAQRKEHDKFDFELHEVFAVDVLISTGEGQGKEKDVKVTVFKKTDETYMLKMKNSREFFSAVSRLPFS